MTQAPADLRFDGSTHHQPMNFPFAAVGAICVESFEYDRLDDNMLCNDENETCLRELEVSVAPPALYPIWHSVALVP